MTMVRPPFSGIREYPPQEAGIRTVEPGAIRSFSSAQARVNAPDTLEIR